MKTTVIASVLTIATTAFAASATQAQDVEYRGEARAAAICQAIVEDNPSVLKAELRKASRDNRNLRFTATNAQSFLCNGEPLDKFAHETGAGKTVAWLENTSTSKTVAQN